MGEKFDPRCHIGEVHGIYTIVDVLNEKDSSGHRLYKCICNECGINKSLSYRNIHAPSQIVTTCRHVRVDGSLITDYKWINQRLRKIFNNMMRRCYGPNNKDYQWYGAKDIGVCEEWKKNPQSFEIWSMNNGYADNLTIDRIDATTDYCPENCQWIPLKENTRRAGKVTWITIGDETLTGRQWADKLQIGTNTINTAIRQHGIDKAIELIAAMLEELPSTKHRKSNQTWFSVYGIQI